MRKFLNIGSVRNFRSLLMRLSRISIKVFTNILLGLRETFEKILGFRVYLAKIIFRTPEENFKKVLCNQKNFRVLSKYFWLNLENDEEIFGKIRRFFSEIVKRLGKSMIFKEVLKNFENITRNFQENFEKTKSKFWRNFLDKKNVSNLSSYSTPPSLAPNRASFSRLPIANYLILVYIRAIARAICEETIFLDAGSGRLPISIQKW